MATMRACYYTKHGGEIKVGELAQPPAPGMRQLLVKVHAASLNPIDWKTASGSQAMLLAFQWPRVYGFDFSGEVVKVGDGVTQFNVGDRIFGMIDGLPQCDHGTLAEFTLVDAGVCAPCPANLSHAECASIPLVTITVVKMLRACGLVNTAGERIGTTQPRILITGGAGGVGSMAIQLVHAMCGASYIVTTASAGPKTELCQQLGASRVIDYRTEKFEEVLAAEPPFHAILDLTDESAKCVALLEGGGGLCSITECPTQEAVRMWLAESGINPRSITTGVRPLLLSRCGGQIFERVSGARQLKRACAQRGATFSHVIGTGEGLAMRQIARYLEDGSIKAVIDREFSLDDAAEAIEYQRAGHAAGKVIINIVGGPCK
jgi:alcohol dehydrogenase